MNSFNLHRTTRLPIPQTKDLFRKLVHPRVARISPGVLAKTNGRHTVEGMGALKFVYNFLSLRTPRVLRHLPSLATPLRRVDILKFTCRAGWARPCTRVFPGALRTAEIDTVNKIVHLTQQWCMLNNVSAWILAFLKKQILMNIGEDCRNSST
jgi:hypothetical protein